MLSLNDKVIGGESQTGKKQQKDQADHTRSSQPRNCNHIKTSPFVQEKRGRATAGLSSTQTIEFEHKAISQTAPLLVLPVELLHEIARFSDLYSHNSLSRTCQALYILLKQTLYRRNSSALASAITNGNIEVITSWIHFGGKMNDNIMSHTALTYAAMSQCATALELLLRTDGDINYKEVDGRTALSYAAEFGCARDVETLLAKGGTIDIADNSRDTPLMIAVGSAKVETVKVLLKKGAKGNFSDRAIINQMEGMDQLLKNYGL